MERKPGPLLQGHRVFASDMTFDASINPIAYEDGEAIFLDTEYDTWNTDPKALEKAIEMYPDVKLYVMVHLKSEQPAVSSRRWSTRARCSLSGNV